MGADGFAVDASLIAADANKQRSVPSKDWKPEEIKESAVRAAREYLATLDDAAFGAASPVTPKFISRSDPAAQWTGAHKGHAFFAYAANYLIDTDHGVIVDVEATRAIRQAEVGAARTMLERTETRFGIKPAFLTADSRNRPSVYEVDECSHPDRPAIRPERQSLRRRPLRYAAGSESRPPRLSVKSKTRKGHLSMCRDDGYNPGLRSWSRGGSCWGAIRPKAKLLPRRTLGHCRRTPDIRSRAHWLESRRASIRLRRRRRSLGQRETIAYTRQTVSKVLGDAASRKNLPCSASRPDYMGGVTPSRPIRRARPCNVPSGCLIAAINTFAPGLRSLLSPRTYATIGVSAAKRSFFLRVFQRQRLPINRGDNLINIRVGDLLLGRRSHE